VDGTVAEREKSAYQGSSALDARITDARAGGAEATVLARMIALDGRLLQLQVVVQGSDVKTAPPDCETFLNSLEIG
jgi:hypothetical protein